MTGSVVARGGRRRIAQTAVWLVGTVAVLLVATAVVGVEDLFDALAAADAGLAAAVAGLALAVLLARGVALWVVLGGLDRPIPVRRALSVYTAATFVNTVAPSGQAGGTPVTGLLIAHSADADYEEGVAAAVSLGLLGNLMIAVFGLAGVAFLLVRPTAGGFDPVVPVAVVAAAGLLTAVVWRLRHRVVDAATEAIWRGVSAIARVVPRVTPPDRSGVEARVDRFVGALAQLRRTSPRRLAALAGLMAVAHGLSLVALWLSFAALGQSVPMGLLLAVVPAAVLAAVIPLPGGLGGVDVALVGLLATTTPTAASVVAAAVVLYRGASYWPRIVLGGAIVLAMVTLGRWR